MTKSRRGLAMFSSKRTKKQSYNVEENMLQNKPQTMLGCLRSIKCFLASDLKSEKLSAGAERSRVESVQLIERVIEEVLERKLLLKDEQKSSLEGSPEPEISNEDNNYENVNVGYCSEEETTDEQEGNVDEDWSKGYIDMATIKPIKKTRKREDDEEGYLDMSTMRRKDRPFPASAVSQKVRASSYPSLLANDTDTSSKEQEKKSLTFSKSVDVRKQRKHDYEDIDDFYVDVVAPDEENVVKHLKNLRSISSMRVRQNAVYSGYLLKRKRKFIGSKWEKVFAVIRNNVMVLFKSEEDQHSTGVIILNGYDISASDKQGKPGFQLNPTCSLTATPRPVHRFRCEDATLDKWLKAVKSLEHRTLSEQQKQAFLKAAHVFDDESDDELSTDDAKKSGVVATTDDYIDINSEELAEKIRTLPNTANETDLYECPQYPDQGETTYDNISDEEQGKKSQTLPNIRDLIEIYECPQYEDESNDDSTTLIYENVPQETVALLSKEVPKPVAKTM